MGEFKATPGEVNAQGFGAQVKTLNPETTICLRTPKE